jgi:hypothetical protein
MNNQMEQLEGRRFLSASVALGTLTVTGTDSADHIIITQQKKYVLVREGSHLTRFNQLSRISHVSEIIVNALGGNDRVTIVSKLSATVDGGDGKDLIIGGAGDDVLMGANGNDRIVGQAGNDSISGGAGRDAIFAGAGDDTIDAYDTEADKVSGGRGNDSAKVDDQIDTAWKIENYSLSSPTTSGSNLVLAGSQSTVHVNAGKLILGGSIGGSGSIYIGGGAGSSTLHLGGSDVLTGASEFNFGTFGDSVNILSNVTLTGSGTQLFDLAGTVALNGAQGVMVYASDLSAAKASLQNAFSSANISGGTLPVDGIIDSGLYAHAGAVVGIAQIGDHIYIRDARIGDLNLDGQVTIEDFINLASSFSTQSTIQLVADSANSVSADAALDSRPEIAGEVEGAESSELLADHTTESQAIAEPAATDQAATPEVVAEEPATSEPLL